MTGLGLEITTNLKSASTSTFKREPMTATTPNELRHNILAAKAEIEAVRQLLLAHEKERH